MFSSNVFGDRNRLRWYCDMGCVCPDIIGGLGFLLCCIGDYGLEGGRGG